MSQLLDKPELEFTDLLWALALEIDERMVTRTGEQVCRACSGRGEVWEWGRSDLAGNVDQHGSPPPQVYELKLLRSLGHVVHVFDRTLERERWAWRSPCPCDGPTRKHTIFLHRLVAKLTAHPRFDWPDEWIVFADKAEARGDWIGRWWVAFRDWTWTEKVPDANALAEDLAAFTPIVLKGGRSHETSKPAA